MQHVSGQIRNESACSLNAMISGAMLSEYGQAMCAKFTVWAQITGFLDLVSGVRAGRGHGAGDLLCMLNERKALFKRTPIKRPSQIRMQKMKLGLSDGPMQTGCGFPQQIQRMLGAVMLKHLKVTVTSDK